MVGNDIIDLAFAEKESDWKRKGFLKKVFTEQERNYISSFYNPGLMVWLLWSMKESVYKITVKEYLKRFLAPLKFECRVEKISEKYFSGKVIFENKKYFTESVVSSDKVLTVACSDKAFPENLISCSFRFSSEDYSGRKNEMNKKFFEDLNGRTNRPAEEFSVIKDDFNIPYLLLNGRHLPSSVSLSHHGRFGAYAAELF